MVKYMMLAGVMWNLLLREASNLQQTCLFGSSFNAKTTRSLPRWQYPQNAKQAAAHTVVLKGMWSASRGYASM
jgi:hypothetical protein